MPGSLSAAISEIKSKLTEDRCAELVGRSDSLVRKWADPDDPAMPNLRQSLVLDAAFVQAGFGEPPIQSWYTNRLEGIVSNTQKSTSNIVASTLHAQAALGNIASAVAQFTEDGSEQGPDLSPNERAALLGMVEELSRNLDLLEESLQENFDMSRPIFLSKSQAR